MRSPPSKLRLSVVMIAHNEARRIRRSLGSVHDIAREIILVHNDCTDDTVKIAKEEFDAQTREHEWHGHRDQKNIALKYAAQPWVLCLDADEEVSTELKESLINFIEKNDAQFDGAFFPRKVWFLGRWITHGDWYPDHSLRLIRNEKGRWEGSSEHDKMALEGKAAKLSGDLHHYTCESLESHLGKISYFGSIFLERLQRKGKRWSSMEVICRASWRFFRCYLIKRGFLDGFPGFYIACFQAFSTLYRYTLLMESINNEGKHR